MTKEIYKLTSAETESLASRAAAFAQELEATVIEAVGYEVGNMQTILYVFERYFVRTENMASLTVLFTNDGKAVTVDVIASGAGEGILNISWGANASFAKMARDLLAKQGFRPVEG